MNKPLESRLFQDSIPYHFHLIWMGPHFPYVNFLAVQTLANQNPDSKITIHFSNPPRNNENWDKALNLAVSKELNISELLEELSGYLPEVSGIKKKLESISKKYPAGVSNILRYIIVYLNGGIYLDFDTLCLKSFRPLLRYPGFIGEEIVYKHDDERVEKGFQLKHLPAAILFGASFAGSRLFSKLAFFSKLWNRLDGYLQNVWSDTKLNNAILGAVPRHPFFKAALESIPSRNPGIKYNLGPILMNDLWEEGSGANMMRLPPPAFYFIPPSQTQRFFSQSPETVPHDAYCIHWCSSNHKKTASAIDFHSISQNPQSCLYSKIASGQF